MRRFPSRLRSWQCQLVWLMLQVPGQTTPLHLQGKIQSFAGISLRLLHLTAVPVDQGPQKKDLAGAPPHLEEFGASLPGGAIHHLGAAQRCSHGDKWT